MRLPKLLTRPALVFGYCVFMASPFSLAESIDPSLSIVGSTSLFDTDPDLATSTWNADLYSVVGGLNTPGAASSLILTDIGDGFGHTAGLSGDNAAFTQLGGNYTITVTNNSPDKYDLLFGITFAHTADSGGVDLDADARSVSELEVTDVSDSEYLFSRLTSENGKDYHDAGNSSWQDQIHDEEGDLFLGTWGDALSGGRTGYFLVTLEGNTSKDIEGIFDLDGRTFDSGATFSTTSQMFLFVYRIRNLSTSDTDEDGIFDAEDNCPLIPNPDQAPSSSSPGRGVVCENLPPGC